MRVIIDATFPDSEYYLFACLEALHSFVECESIAIACINTPPILSCESIFPNLNFFTDTQSHEAGFLLRTLTERGNSTSKNPIILISARTIFIRKIDHIIWAEYKRVLPGILRTIDPQNIPSESGSIADYLNCNETHGSAEEHGEFSFSPEGMIKNDMQSDCTPASRFLNIDNAQRSSKDLSSHALYYSEYWDRFLYGRSRNRLSDIEADSARILQSLYHSNCRRQMVALMNSCNAKEALRTILRNEEYRPRGIFHSEMLAITGVCQLLNIDVVIESGRANGQSTEVLAKTLSSEIYSIELVRDEVALAAEKRLEKYKNVNLLYGDSHLVVKDLLVKLKGKKIALLLDGPKGRDALTLSSRLLGFNELAVVFVHDMRLLERAEISIGRYWAYKHFELLFFTDDPDWVTKSSELDCNFLMNKPECNLDSWRPYFKSLEYVGSYGPTLLVAVPTQRDRNVARMNITKWNALVYHSGTFLKAILHRIKKFTFPQ